MFRAFLTVLFLAGCVQLPPTPQDLQAKRFEPVPGQSVIYVVRTPLDSSEPQTLMLNQRATIATLPGSYFRWEVPPGRHHIEAFGFGSESLTLITEPGGIYFLEHTVIGDPEDGGVQLTSLRRVDDRYGRGLVARSQLVR
ncbi:MAG: DUF2846 domain-containing protein [Betaproteobacteria bacterium]|nr:DUF2846 domain-containing protein [Betaproteobacteria bacterium]